MSLLCFQNQPEKRIIQNHDVWHGGKQSLCIYMGSGMLSHLLYSSLGLQLGYKVLFFSEMRQHMSMNLTNYRNSMLYLYCDYTSAHAVKAVVSVRYMLDITKGLTSLARQTNVAGSTMKFTS